MGSGRDDSPDRDRKRRRRDEKKEEPEVDEGLLKVRAAAKESTDRIAEMLRKAADNAGIPEEKGSSSQAAPADDAEPAASGDAADDPPPLATLLGVPKDFRSSRKKFSVAAVDADDEDSKPQGGYAAPISVGSLSKEGGGGFAAPVSVGSLKKDSGGSSGGFAAPVSIGSLKKDAGSGAFAAPVSVGSLKKDAGGGGFAAPVSVGSLKKDGGGFAKPVTVGSVNKSGGGGFAAPVSVGSVKKAGGGGFAAPVIVGAVKKKAEGGYAAAVSVGKLAREEEEPAMDPAVLAAAQAAAAATNSGGAVPMEETAGAAGGAAEPEDGAADTPQVLTPLAVLTADGGSGTIYSLAQAAEEAANYVASAAMLLANPSLEDAVNQAPTVLQAAEQATKRAVWASDVVLKFRPPFPEPLPGMPMVQVGSPKWVATVKQAARLAVERAEQALLSCRASARHYAAGGQPSNLPAAGANSAGLRPTQKSKVPCKFHEQGLCFKGEGCPMSHDENHKNPKPFMHKRGQPCQYFDAGSCNRGDACTFAHGKEELNLLLSLIDADKSRGGSGRGNDWICPQCKMHNYHKHTRCRACNAEKPGGSNGPQTIQPPTTMPPPAPPMAPLPPMTM
eukprot:TRINITY_DN82731_c0_g1_i1.p1 TRINITY_DN82731_c0_g1~~TRINITY_DN82731_c0_g1_i1.p1  ORF type:complete len:656 (-),score=150.61 TRINITY_DN82731_c0_g1_i1:99-1946(-)